MFTETMKNLVQLVIFYAKRLQRRFKNVPIGLISSNWGGTSASLSSKRYLKEPELLKVPGRF
jgi:sialate O-acetylesterase